MAPQVIGLGHVVVSLAPEKAVKGWIDSVTEIVWRTVYEGYR